MKNPEEGNTETKVKEATEIKEVKSKKIKRKSRIIDSNDDECDVIIYYDFISREDRLYLKHYIAEREKNEQKFSNLNTNLIRPVIHKKLVHIFYARKCDRIFQSKIEKMKSKLDAIQVNKIKLLNPKKFTVESSNSTEGGSLPTEKYFNILYKIKSEKEFKFNPSFKCNFAKQNLTEENQGKENSKNNFISKSNLVSSSQVGLEVISDSNADLAQKLINDDDNSPALIQSNLIYSNKNTEDVKMKTKVEELAEKYLQSFYQGKFSFTFRIF